MTGKGGSDLKSFLHDARFGSRREWPRQVCPTIASPRGTRGLRCDPEVALPLFM